MQDGQGRTASGGGWGMEWHGICWRSSDVPPDEAAGARIGTAEAAGGRTPWDLRMWVGGRRVSAGGGMGFAAVAAGEGPRAKGGGLSVRRSLRTIPRRPQPLETFNENVPPCHDSIARLWEIPPGALNASHRPERPSRPSGRPDSPTGAVAEAGPGPVGPTEAEHSAVRPRAGSPIA